MVLPSGFSLPPLPYIVVLVVAVSGVGGQLYRARPAVEETTALALIPWIVTGGALRVVERRGVVSEVVAPLLTAPAVYGTMVALTGVTWLVLLRTTGDPNSRSGEGSADASARDRRIAWRLAVTGEIVLIGTLLLLAPGITRLWPAVAVIGAAVVALPVILGYRHVRPGIAARAGGLGPVVIFSHALDGTTTALGVDLLGVAEQSPLPRLLMDLAARLPTADLIGVGWLFLGVKLGVAVLLVHLVGDLVHDRPRRGRLLLVAVAAVGLGPGVHNLLLFMTAT